MKLEAFYAKWGDALLLHYGTKKKPRYALIDGGPAGTFEGSVRSGLNAHAKDGQIHLEFTSVSHVDDDHIDGMVELFEHVKDGGDEPTITMGPLFCNVFGVTDMVRPEAYGDLEEDELRKAVFQEQVRRQILLDAARRAELEAEEDPAELAEAAGDVQTEAYSDGTSLSDLAADKNVSVEQNPPERDCLLSGDEFPEDVVGSVHITVVAPSRARVEALFAAWEVADSVDVAAVADADDSVTNLSSLILYVRSGNGANAQSMLLTGDGLGGDAVAGLVEAGVMGTGEELHVDILKLAHHGSQRNDPEKLFASVKAKHYLASANGRYGNPDLPTLIALVDAEKDREFTIWLTGYLEGESASLKKFETTYHALMAHIKDVGAQDNVTVVHGTEGGHPLLIDLDED